MGIQGLWELLDAAVQVRTLNDISLMNGYSAANKKNILRIGVDISVVMNECVAAEKASHMYCHKTAGELRIFLFKLCKYLRKAPAIMIFVFDGPNRPSFKHGRNIDTHTIPDWSNHCKTLIEAFGFYWHQAPGEAEAELAMLSRYNAIDAVMTSDSDALVFGAQCVIKPIKGAPDQYAVYSMDVIENTVGLSYGSLLLVALLSKGDYSDGLAGCGSGISASLACCGFGDRILCAVNQLEDFKLRRELDSITADIQEELRSNSHNFLNSRYPTLASNFSVKIIAPEKISAYINPIITTGSPSPGLMPLTIPIWIMKEPSIPRISQFCRLTFGWAQTSLEKKLENVLWPGVFLRILTSRLLIYNDTKKLCVTPHNQTEILKYSTNSFVALMGNSMNRATKTKMKAWVSPDYLPANLISTPIMVIHHSPRVSPCASTSALVAATPLDFMNTDSKSTSIPQSSASESPDPPSVMDMLYSVRHIHRLATTREYVVSPPASGEILEITDSESDVEIIHSSHTRMHSFSPETIVISD